MTIAVLRAGDGLARFMSLEGAPSGADFDALTRFRGFYVKSDVPDDRKAYLVAACKAGFETEQFQAFNKKKFMDLINSYRDTEGSVKLINDAVQTYRTMYKELGISN